MTYFSLLPELALNWPYIGSSHPFDGVDYCACMSSHNSFKCLLLVLNRGQPTPPIIMTSQGEPPWPMRFLRLNMTRYEHNFHILLIESSQPSSIFDCAPRLTPRVMLRQVWIRFSAIRSIWHPTWANIGWTWNRVPLCGLTSRQSGCRESESTTPAGLL